MNKSESGREFHVTGSPPLTILATFTVPAPISVAVRLRRVWYRSAAPIVASKGLHLSSVPKVVDLFMSPRTPRTSNWSLATLRRPLRYAKMTVASPGRTRIAAARRAASAHARRDSCVRRWGFACSWILALRASFYMPKAEYPAFPGARAARMMHLLQVYDTAQLRGYPRIVREYLVYSAFSLRHVRWGVGGIKVTPPPISVAVRLRGVCPQPESY